MSFSNNKTVSTEYISARGASLQEYSRIMQHAMHPVWQCSRVVMVCLKWFSLWNITTCRRRSRPETTGAARKGLLDGYSISGYYTIYFCLPNPQQNKIIIHVMHCIPKELRFWNKTWIIPTFGKRGKMALLKHHINGICSKTVQNDNDIVYHVPTHFDFHKQIICMIWLLIESLNHQEDQRQYTDVYRKDWENR